MEQPKKRKKIVGLFLLIVAFLILSIIIPLILSEFAIRNDSLQISGRLLIQAEVVNSNIKMETNFGNLLSVITTTKDTLAKRAIELNRMSAKEALIGKLVLLHTAIYKEVPSKNQLDMWNTMNFVQLDKIEDEIGEYKTSWVYFALEKIKTLKLMLYILYGISLICQGFGLFLINL